MSGSGFHLPARGRRFTAGNSIRLVSSGTNFFSTLEILIAQARDEILLQTYIFESDETGSRIAEALIRAAGERGVKIYLLVDAFGSQHLSREIREDMKAAGIEIHNYGRFFNQGRFHIGRRLHSKVVVIDGHTAVVGGLNISNNYNELPGKKAWLDFAVVVRGPVVRLLHQIWRKQWKKGRFQRLPVKPADPLSASPLPEISDVLIRVSQNDFLRNKNAAAVTYRKAILESSRSLLILGGYFLPGGKVRRLIRQATRRGVKIRIIVSDKSDVRVSVLARKYLYDWMIRNGISIYEYQPANVHGKVLVADDHFVSIGSYDLNNLSTYSNIELNLDIESEAFAAEMNSCLEVILERDCKLVREEEYHRQRTLKDRLAEWLAYRFVKILCVLSIWLSSRREPDY